MKKVYFLIVFYLVSHSCFCQLTLVEWNFPNNPDNAIADLGIFFNSFQTLTTVGGTAAVGYGTNTGATTQSAWCTGWNSGAVVKWWEIQVNTSGYYNLEISSKQRSSSTGPKHFALEYKIGAGGAWTAVPAAPATIVVGDNFTTGVLTGIALPAACENQAAVYFRWIMTTNTPVSSGVSVSAAGSSRIDDVNVSSHDSNNHYRTIGSGNWNSLSTWQSSPDLVTWSAAQFIPSRYSKTIVIRSPHLVSINSNVSMDETTIQPGGGVNYNSGIMTINDGTGVDFQVDGFFTDGASNSVVWTGAAPRWALGANGTYTKTENTNATNWRDNYNVNINTIPSTANWVIHKTPSSVTAPSLVTINMYYPNLTIMNTSGGLWTTVTTSTFTGSSSTVTIKGNLDVGGTLTFLGTVDFLDDNTNALPVQVLGNMRIRAGCNLRNYGTGFELYGNFTVDGSTTYDANDARIFKFSGGGAQSISGTGGMPAFQVYQMQMTKTANALTLNRPVKVDNNLDLQNGVINSTLANILVIEDNATVTNTSNASYVQGPVTKYGDDPFTFPIGKNSNYRSLAINGALPITFWSEDFNNGCNFNCLASAYSGPNGAWTLTNTGPASDCGYPIYPNLWYVSCTENGNAVGSCGTGCAGNATLHIGLPANPYNDAFPCSPDCGAVYDPGGYCGNSFPTGSSLIGPFSKKMDQRMESPTINCTGMSNINISFKYIFGGISGHSYSAVMYYDGAAWSQLALLPQTTPCSSGQKGTWTSYSITLPSSANNNANVKVAFRWVNDDFFTAPAAPYAAYVSVAIDDVSIAAVESFTAEYFNSNPQVPYGTIMDPTLNHISTCEYWILTRNVGTSNRLVTLSWSTNSCGVSLPSDLRVARYNPAGTIWNDLGNGGTSGTTTAGTVVTSAPVSLYGPFTLASSTIQNPLPIELIKFDAKYNGRTVDLSWITTSEINNNYFTIERTADEHDFLTILKVPGKGNSSTTNYYTANDDTPLKGLSFYRLMQTDYDGQKSFSKLVPVRINDRGFGIDYLFSDQYAGEIYFSTKGFLGNATVVVIDVLGRQLISQKLFLSGEKEIFKLNALNLKEGVYTLRVFDSERVINKNFFY